MERSAWSWSGGGPAAGGKLVGKLIKVVLLLGILAAAIVGVTMWSQSKDVEEAPRAAADRAKQGEGGVRAEEKYGFTTESVNLP